LTYLSHNFNLDVSSWWLQVRYLDSVPVHVKKGEKYVVEQPGKDWDGGLRDKVYTKGKRSK
jgi:hypothetical protein